MNKLETLIWLKTWYDERKAGLQTQPALIRAIKNEPIVEQRLTKLYFELFNKTLGGCGSCLADAMAEIYLYSRKNVENIMKCNFVLKSGVLLADPKNKLPMATAANLTDEIAVAYLVDNVARKNLFEKMPDNVDEIIKAAEKQIKAAAKKAAAEAAKAEAEKIAAEKAAAEEAERLAAEEAAKKAADEAENANPDNEPESEKESEESPENEPTGDDTNVTE